MTFFFHHRHQLFPTEDHPFLDVVTFFPFMAFQKENR